MSDPQEHTNRLIHETSPYLLQHAHNPVDWYPWGPEALAKAADEDKPIFLSIGYSACHWCHVMAHESFEDDATARVMNEHVVSIKVDREERPDLDALYMEAVQQLTGSGGWPMSVFLTPDGAPFSGGTYFPPEPRYQMPSFRQVLLAITEAWRTRREAVERQAAEFREAFGRTAISGFRKPEGFIPLEASVPAETLAQAAEALLDRMDPVLGGFGPAPKFPQPMTLDFLLRVQARRGSPRGELAEAEQPDRLLRLVQLTLDKMAAGGMNDQLGGGFHRYSTDARWLVPHFEKMLYDNALLVPVYLHAWQLTGEARYRAVADDVLGYVMREMTHPDGAFLSSQDADSEGEEGVYYVWTTEQLRGALGEEDATLAMSRWGVSEGGNFEGTSILHVAQPEEVSGASIGLSREAAHERLGVIRARLLAARAERVAPGTDDKAITAWNGWMLRAFAEAARATGNATYAEVARRNAAFVTTSLLVDGRLRRVWRAGQSKPGAYLEDYASLINALISLYEVSADGSLVAQALTLAETMLDLYWDPTTETFFDTARDADTLIGRPRDLMDNATPSGTSLACEALLRLSALTGDLRLREHAARILVPLAPAMAEHPTAFGHLLCALDDLIGPFDEIALVGTPGSADLVALRAAVASQFLPRSVLATSGTDDIEVPLLAERPLREGKATAYVCEGQVCQAPVTTTAELLTRLR